MTLNAALAGLVAITAGCDAVSVGEAAVIDLISGFLIVFAVEFFDQKAKIDDPVGAVSVHFVHGIFGTICVGLFSVKDGLFYGGGTKLLLTQLIGVVSVVLYTAAALFILFKILDHTLGLRVPEEDEISGLDISEHNLSSSYADFLPAPEHFTRIATTLAPVEPVTAVPAAVVEGKAAAQGQGGDGSFRQPGAGRGGCSQGGTLYRQLRRRQDFRQRCGRIGQDSYRRNRFWCPAGLSGRIQKIEYKKTRKRPPAIAGGLSIRRGKNMKGSFCRGTSIPGRPSPLKTKLTWIRLQQAGAELVLVPWDGAAGNFHCRSLSSGNRPDLQAPDC